MKKHVYVDLSYSDKSLLTIKTVELIGNLINLCYSIEYTFENNAVDSEKECTCNLTFLRIPFYYIFFL